jgi:hypothetical protein
MAGLQVENIDVSLQLNECSNFDADIRHGLRFGGLQRRDVL